MMKDQGCKAQMVGHPELFPGGVAPKELGSRKPGSEISKLTEW
jgi:hypothetical protein